MTKNPNRLKTVIDKSGFFMSTACSAKSVCSLIVLFAGILLIPEDAAGQNPSFTEACGGSGCELVATMTGDLNGLPVSWSNLRAFDANFACISFGVDSCFGINLERGRDGEGVLFQDFRCDFDSVPSQCRATADFAVGQVVENSQVASVAELSSPEDEIQLDGGTFNLSTCTGEGTWVWPDFVGDFATIAGGSGTWTIAPLAGSECGSETPECRVATWSSFSSTEPFSEASLWNYEDASVSEVPSENDVALFNNGSQTTVTISTDVTNDRLELDLSQA